MLGLHPSTMATRDRSGLGDYATSAPTEHRWSPYVDNHGSVVAVAGADFVVVASDTRLSGHGYSILTREQPKLFEMGPKTVLGATGCWCDVLTFTRLADARYGTTKMCLIAKTSCREHGSLGFVTLFGSRQTLRIP